MATLLTPVSQPMVEIVDPTTGLHKVWEDTFNTWDPVWSTRQTVYTEDQPCAKSGEVCARVHNGEMVLSVRKDPDNPGKYLTGHVGAKKEFTFGYYEARIQFPDVFGTLDGWWLRPVGDYTSDDPLTPLNERGVEIDIVECGGRSKFHHTIWYRDPGQGIGEFHKPPPQLTTDVPKGFQAGVHDYGVLWLPTGYTFYIDRIPVGSITGGLSVLPVAPVLSIKLPKYLMDAFDPDRIKDYKMRIKRVGVWELP